MPFSIGRFLVFFVYMSKNRKKVFHWANFPDDVKSESRFWGQLSINLNLSLRLDWDLWFIIFLRFVSTWKWLPEIKIFSLAPNQTEAISLDRVYIVTRCVIPECEMAFALSPAQVFSSRAFGATDYARPSCRRGRLLSIVNCLWCVLSALR